MAGKTSAHEIASLFASATSNPPMDEKAWVAPQNLFALDRVRKQFSQPCDRGDEFNADADENQASPKQQLLQGGGITCREGGERIQQNAARQDPATPKPIGQVTAQQPENTAGQGRNKEEGPCPSHIVG